MKTAKKIQKFMVLMAIGVLCLFGRTVRADAAALSDYEPGTYEIEAELSCYVNAMGGVEFGGPLLTSAVLNVDEDGTASITLNLTKSSVTIYSVTCDTFIDADPAYVTDDRGVTSGTIGYYDEDGNLTTKGVSYTLSEDTALNTADEEVNYVDSITFPLTYESDTYNLTLYVNSNVMGVQFCNENDDAESATYPATLTVYWDGASESIETKEDESEVGGEDMDGLTLYSAASNDDSTISGELEAAANELEEENASSVLFGNVPTAALIVILVIGCILIVLGILSLIINIKSSDKKKDE